MSIVVLQHPKATQGVGHARAEGAGTHYGRRFSMARSLRTLVVAVLGMASVGCATEVDAPATATRLVPEGRVVCSNLQLDIPKGWTLEPTGPNQWRMVAPQSSSYEGWVGCTDGNIDSFQPRKMQEDSAEQLGWPQKLSAPETRMGMDRMLQSGPEKSRDSVLIGCRQFEFNDDRFESCIWGDPYPRGEQRADGYIGMRWVSSDRVADAQLRELAASVMRSFIVTPMPEAEYERRR